MKSSLEFVTLKRNSRHAHPVTRQCICSVEEFMRHQTKLWKQRQRPVCYGNTGLMGLTPFGGCRETGTAWQRSSTPTLRQGEFYLDTHYLFISNTAGIFSLPSVPCLCIIQMRGINTCDRAYHRSADVASACAPSIRHATFLAAAHPGISKRENSCVLKK